MSKSAEKMRERAGTHRTLAKLYDRAAAKLELEETLRDYGEQLKENAEELARLEEQCKKLEADLVKDATAAEVPRVRTQ